MIIIKSQDGSIAEYDKIEAPSKWNERDKHCILARKNQNRTKCIGIYKTETRAKEVMDMIEKRICQNIADKIIVSAPNFRMTTTVMEQLSERAIFTMPEV